MKLQSKKSEIQLVVGGESRVDLLPPEVAQRTKSRSTRRVLVAAVALTALVVAGGYAFAFVNATASQMRLIAAQAETTGLLQKQGEFIEIRQVESDLLGAEAAKAVAGSTEIDWKSYFAVLNDTLPEGAALRGLGLESSTPIEAAPTAVDIPLRAPNVATLTLEAASPAVIDVKSWLISLETVPGFVDAVPKTVTRQDDGSYRASVVLHVNEGAHWNRFLPEEPAQGDAETTSSVTDEGN